MDARKLFRVLVMSGAALALVIELARRSARDERNHARLCAAICEGYGGSLFTGAVHDHPASWPGLFGADRVLYEVVSFACIAETINVQLLSAVLRRASAP